MVNFRTQTLKLGKEQWYLFNGGLGGPAASPKLFGEEKLSYNKSQQDALFLKFIYTCFGQTYCPSSGVLILYSQQLVLVILC